MKKMYNEKDTIGQQEYTPYQLGLHKLYEDLFKLESIKPIGVHPDWDKEYETCKNKIREYEI